MRKICAMILLCALLLGLSGPVQAAQSGSCGETVSWRFENGVLVLSGSGAMENYTDASRIPWWGLRDQILSVTVEERITSVGDLSFAQCSKLVSVSLPDSLEKIGKNAFWGCRELESVVLPENLTELESGAFFQCASLGQISIPTGITVLEQAVFARCEHLDMVALHDGIVEIKQDAFSRCYALKHIALPVSLERIETHAFFGCAQLQQLTFPQGFARIDEAPFYGCVSLKTLRFLGSAPELHENAFLDIEAEIFYSMHDRSWDTAAQRSYGGKITWTKECFHAYTVTTTPPGCLTEGYSTFECSLCADSYRDLYIPALGHDFVNYISNGDATCTQDGTKTAVCDRCDATDTQIDEGSAHGHDFSEWSVVEEPTPTADGLESRFCRHCGIEETRVVPKLENPFTDVSDGSYYYTPVLWALANGITNGTSDTTFRPDAKCLRAQVVTFLWRTAGSPEPGITENPFVDVEETEYYYKAVLWAVEQGITDGIEEDRFGPMNDCTRAQAVTFLWRSQGKPDPSGAEMPFTDVEKDAWYEAPILWAVKNGVTNGVSAIRFGINVICSRAQIVTFLYRTYN